MMDYKVSVCETGDFESPSTFPSDRPAIMSALADYPTGGEGATTLMRGKRRGKGEEEGGIGEHVPGSSFRRSRSKWESVVKG